MAEKLPSEFGTTKSPFDTEELRKELAYFLDTPFMPQVEEKSVKVGNIKWGCYAFFDYDGEPIYVGQTYEKIRTRIRRHLTNQRTDAVAMSVLDPFEVHDIEVWPLYEYENIGRNDANARRHLDKLEFTIYRKCIEQSAFGAVLNEKDPPQSPPLQALPRSFRASIVSVAMAKLRAHPDIRIARRAQTMARLAQIISERKVRVGLRRVLSVQAKRLQWLTDTRERSL